MAGMYPNDQILTIFDREVRWPGMDADGKFTNGSFSDPLEGGSFVPAATINLILDNITAVLEAHGMTPNNFGTDQLAEAISKAIEKSENGFGLFLPGRNLMDVLGVTTVPEAMAALRERCNGAGAPDFSGLQIGDYLDGLNLSAIPAERGGDAGQAWNSSYKNNRLVLAAFNPYKGVGDTEVTQNHVRFDFANVPLRGRMNASNDNTGGYTATEMRAFLDGVNGDGTGDKAGVTTAAFLNALKAQIGDYILPVRRLLSNKASNWEWKTYSLWLPSEDEVFGESAWGESGYGDGQKLHIPLYRDSYLYRIKRYNGGRMWWWLNTPYAGSAAYFCDSSNPGNAYYTNASSVGGCAPAFCVA